MKSSRYSSTRQKSCNQCASARAKCDRQSGRCSRCTSRGLSCSYAQIDSHSLDFSNLSLACPINADDISNRWLNVYVPLPGQRPKNYPPAITSFVHNVLKAYTMTVVRGRDHVPPFIHATQMRPTVVPLPLATCMSLVRASENPAPGSENMITDLLRKEMTSILEQAEGQDEFTLLASFQAYLLYAMVLFFKLNQGSSPFLKEAMMNLQELACRVSKQGLICAEEQDRARPRWEAWITAETKRRTLYTMYLFDNVLSAFDGLPTFIGTELYGLPAPSNRDLWISSSRNSWEASYSVHLAEWDKGGLKLDELWPLPADLDERGISLRRQRVERWLEDVDEYGTMLYAVTSCTHGG